MIVQMAFFFIYTRLCSFFLRIFNILLLACMSCRPLFPHFPISLIIHYYHTAKVNSALKYNWLCSFFPWLYTLMPSFFSRSLIQLYCSHGYFFLHQLYTLPPMSGCSFIYRIRTLIHAVIRFINGVYTFFVIYWQYSLTLTFMSLLHSSLVCSYFFIHWSYTLNPSFACCLHALLVIRWSYTYCFIWLCSFSPSFTCNTLLPLQLQGFHTVFILKLYILHSLVVYCHNEVDSPQGEDSKAGPPLPGRSSQPPPDVCYPAHDVMLYRKLTPVILFSYVVMHSCYHIYCSCLMSFCSHID